MIHRHVLIGYNGELGFLMMVDTRGYNIMENGFVINATMKGEDNEVIIKITATSDIK